MKAFFKKILTDVTGWFKGWNKAKSALAIGLALVLVGGFVASMIQTDFFNVSVETKTIEVDITNSVDATSGAISKAEETGIKTWSTADIYKPKSASAENPVPMILIAPGIQRTKETQSSFCIELVRRGYGVICIDPYGQGESAPSYESQSATKEGYGLFHWMDYLYTAEGMEEFAWVDYSRIGATGHSAGGNGAQKLAEREGKLANDTKQPSRVQAVYVTGYIRGWTWQNTACNIGISYSSADEGAFQNKTAVKKAEIEAKIEAQIEAKKAEIEAKIEAQIEAKKAEIEAKKAAGYTLTAEEEFFLTVDTKKAFLLTVDALTAEEEFFDTLTAEEKFLLTVVTLTAEEEFWLTVGNADMRYAPESIDIVNYQLKRAGQQKIDEVEVGAFYGNPYEGTFAIINNESCLHAMQPYDAETLTNLVSFFGYVFDNYDSNDLQNGVKDDSQSWLVKEIGGGMMLVGGFVFILALLSLLLKTSLFASLKKEIPVRTGNQKIKGRIIFWLAFVASAVIASVLYIKCAVLSVDWFKDAANSVQTWFFPQRFTNAVMMWAVANGLIGVAIFFFTWGLEFVIDLFLGKSSCDEVKASYFSKLDPLKMNLSDLWKTLLMAAILILSFFALDGIAYGIFHADMRFFFLSARFTLNPKVILAIAMYIPFFFIFYMSNSLRVNCSMRPENWPEWLSQIIAVLGNTVGLVGIVVMQYLPFIKTGTIGYTGTVGPEWLFVNMLFSIIPMMAALPLLNRYFFNKTGRAWLGAIVVCAIFVIMTGSGTTIYYAL